MYCMFSFCSSLKELNLSNFISKCCTTTNHMFEGCSYLKELNFPKFNINTVKDKDDMFIGCSTELKNKIKEENKYFKDFDIKLKRKGDCLVI